MRMEPSGHNHLLQALPLMNTTMLKNRFQRKFEGPLTSDLSGSHTGLLSYWKQKAQITGHKGHKSEANLIITFYKTRRT